MALKFFIYKLQPGDQPSEKLVDGGYNYKDGFIGGWFEEKDGQELGLTEVTREEYFEWLRSTEEEYNKLFELRPKIPDDIPSFEDFVKQREEWWDSHMDK